MDPGILGLVSSRLEADGSADEAWATLVLAASEGATRSKRCWRGEASRRGRRPLAPLPCPSAPSFSRSPSRGSAVSVPADTRAAAGSGLTLVVGRNGSGKSSFGRGTRGPAHGDSLRWKERAAVWREGWRNLHHPAAALDATFLVEGESAPCVRVAAVGGRGGVRRREGGGPAAGRERVRPRVPGVDRRPAHASPFLSYNELGSLLDEGPSKLYDALSSILGLEDLVAAWTASRNPGAAARRP